MGVRNTADENKVALFDSVSGYAFGPTFDTADEAESFLAYVADCDGRDLREIPDSSIAAMFGGWASAQESE